MISYNHNFMFGSAMPNFVAIDTESDGIIPWAGHRIFSAAASFPGKPTMFWRDSDLHTGGLRRILEDETIDKVFHNAKHDMRMLRHSGFRTVRGRIWDTMIFCHLLDGRNAGKGLSLENCARRYLPPDRRKVVDEITKFFDENRIGEERRHLSFGILPPDLLMRRNVGDAELTRDIFMRVYKTVALTFPFLLKQEHRLLPVVDKMEERGIAIDYDEIDPQIDYFHDIYEYVMRFCEGVTGNDEFSMESPSDQIELLKAASCANEDGLYGLIQEFTKPAKGRKSDKPFVPKRKMDDWNLRQLHHPVAHMLILGKAAKKMRDTFLESMKEHSIAGVLRSSFNQVGTSTGRFSSSGPNLQNIPIEGDRRTSYTEEEALEAFEMTGINYAPHIKRIFVCRPGMAHIHSDKKQAEMFWMNAYANDPATHAIFAKSLESGRGIHDEICIAMYGEWTKGLKTRTKAVVFGYQFGASDPTLAKKIGGTIQDAQRMRLQLGRTLPGLPKLKKMLYEQLDETGYITTFHGRRHYMPPNETYMCVNRICQGSNADEVKSRMVALNDYFESEIPEAQLILNVHDDLASEVPIEERHKAAKDIHRIMEETSVPVPLPLPSSLDITYTRWSDLKEIENGKPFPEPPAELVTRNRPKRTVSRLGVG